MWKIKNRILMIGIGLLAFGLVNWFSYLPTSLGVALMYRPFPFEHLHNVHPDKGGTHVEIGYLPIREAINDPYWLAWSLALYAGIVLITIVVCFTSLRKNNEGIL